MTAKISDFKRATRRKIKQVISADRGRESERQRERDERMWYLQTLLFSTPAPAPLLSVHMCGCKHEKETQRGLCNNPSMCCVTAPGSEKWWLYVNCAWVDCASVHQVVKKSFIKQMQPYQGATSAGKFCRCRKAAEPSLILFLCSLSLIFFLVLPFFLCLSPTGVPIFSRTFVSEALNCVLHLHSPPSPLCQV